MLRNINHFEKLLNSYKTQVNNKLEDINIDINNLESKLYRNYKVLIQSPRVKLTYDSPFTHKEDISKYSFLVIRWILVDTRFGSTDAHTVTIPIQFLLTGLHYYDQDYYQSTTGGASQGIAAQYVDGVLTLKTHGRLDMETVVDGHGVAIQIMSAHLLQGL